MPVDGDLVTTLDSLPDDLPIPADDGAADHLVGTGAPAVELITTGRQLVVLDQLDGATVLFAYPRTGVPGEPMPTGWDSIPGARGCTPQACGIRDAHAEFTALGVRVLGLSTQTPAEQAEVARRLHLTYPLLSDSEGKLTQKWRLPTFTVDGLPLLRRMTLFLTDGVVDGLIYPVFPPDRAARAALAWLHDRSANSPISGEPNTRGSGMAHPIPPRLVR